MRLIFKIAKKFSKLANLLRNKILKSKVENLRQIKDKYCYTTQPEITMILQHFNKKENIKKIIERLRLTAADEIIVIDDGSVDGSYEEWLKYLDRPNDFLLRCNDLFEVRTYDRAISMARGKYICLLQDDDIPPPNNTWVEQAITLFETFPKLLMLGGRQGLNLLIPDPESLNDIEQKYQRVGDIAGRPGVNKYHIYDTPLYLEPTSNISFMFTMVVNRAPVFLRKDYFLEIGGINQEYAPFQCDDVDASIRVWLAGYQVGFYNCPFSRDVGTGGMRVFNSKKVQGQDKINWQKIYSFYSHEISNKFLENVINNANEQLIQKSEALIK